MPSEIIVEDCGKFKQLYNLPENIDTIVCIGGRGGRKTWEVSKFVTKSVVIDKKRCVILRDEQTLIRESILNDISNCYDRANEHGHLSPYFDKLDNGIKDKKTGEMLLFTKGFRASDSQKKANLKGVSDIDIAVIEEAEDIRDEGKFNTFHDSLRKKGCVVIIILNTPDITHWIIKRYFICHPVPGADGFFNIEPKNINGFLCIKASFRDNPYLPQHIIDRYNAYGNPNDAMYNPYYFNTAIEGYASTGRRGQILTKVQRIKLSEYWLIDAKEVYGQDFGTASPAGFIGVKFLKNNCYVRQINYLPKDTLALGRMYSQLKLSKSDKIIADSAEPKTIERLSRGWRETELDKNDADMYPALMKGFHIIPAIKGPGSIKAGIGLMQSMNIFAVEESTDLWNEFYNWVYAVDKNLEPTDEPLDDFNHCFVGDTLITTILGQRKIADVKEGYFVLTSNGWNKVLKKWDNGIHHVNKYVLHFDTFNLSLTCTKDHKIKTTEGWISIGEVKSTHQIYLSKFLTENLSNCTQGKDILAEDVKDYIQLYGNNQTVVSQMDLMFTTLTETHGITKFQTSKLKKQNCITKSIQKADLRTIQNLQLNFKGRELQPLRHGINQKKEKNGIPLQQSINLKTGYLKNINAYNAQKSSNQEQYREQNTVTKIARLRQIDVEEKSFHQVYDLMVENTHEYFANGVLVHNCIDPLRYCIMDYKGLPVKSFDRSAFR
jgi:hypothetical protein